jgi:hypothetical protein
MLYQIDDLISVMTPVVHKHLYSEYVQRGIDHGLLLSGIKLT